MFKFKGPDVITLFHKPNLPNSVRVQTLLKRLCAEASETATEDQASDHSHQNKQQRTEFQLNVTEDPPTKDQMRSMLEYAGGKKASQLIKDATDEADALKKLGENGDNFERPVTVDWNNGKIVVGHHPSQIMKLVAELPTK